MSRASKIGPGPERAPTVSLQKEEEAWLLSIQGMTAVAKIHTDADLTKYSYEDSTLEETDYGWRAKYVVGRGADDLYILGSFSKIEVEGKETKFDTKVSDTVYYKDDEKVATGVKHTYMPPLLERPMVQAGIGIVGVGVATGLVGRWLGWW